MKKKYIIPIFIPHLGCNNECVFCNQRSISGTKKQKELEEIDREIYERAEELSGRNKVIEVAFFGGSFTGLDVNYQIKLLEIANKYIDNGFVSSIRISTRPDYISKDILDMLKTYNVKTIELGVQSLDEEVLDRSKRGHNENDVINASKLIKQNGFILGHQIMIGLPNSDIDKEVETALKSVSLKPEIVRIYPVLVIRNTELEKMYNKGEYIPLSLEEAIYRSAEAYKIYKRNNIDVIRIGLQANEDFDKGIDLIVGPYHPSFGEMVLSKIWYDDICDLIDKNKEIYGIVTDKISITVSPNNLSKVIGNKKENIIRIEKRYSGKVSVKSDINFSEDDMSIKCE